MSCLSKAMLLASSLAVFAAPLRADDPAPLPAEVAELLELGWDSSGEALAAAANEFATLRPKAPADQRLLYAFALVQLKHRRTQAALKLIEEAAEADPADLRLGRAHTWLLMLTKKHEAALVQMQALAEALGAEAAAEGQADGDKELHADLAGFLGRMFGYLEGPAAGKLDSDRLAETREQAVSQLGTGLAPDFEEGRRAVLEKHDELSLRHEQAQETAKADQREEQGRLAERLDTEQADIAIQRDDLAQQAERAKTSLEATLRDIDSKLATLERAFAQLAAEAAPFRDAMLELDRRIGRLLAAADMTQDPIEEGRLRLEVDRLGDLYGLNERRYNLLDAQARQVRAQGDALSGERRAAEERYQDEIDRLQKREGGLRRTEKRIAQDRRKTTKPTTGAIPKVRSLAAQAAALTTYDEFPLEQERQRLLRLKAVAE